MKKSIYFKKGVFLGSFLFFLVTILSSCGPSACECYDNFKYHGLDANTSVLLDCNEKYGDQIPDSYRGTEKWGDEMRKILKEECPNYKDFHRPSDQVD